MSMWNKIWGFIFLSGLVFAVLVNVAGAMSSGSDQPRRRDDDDKK